MNQSREQTQPPPHDRGRGEGRRGHRVPPTARPARAFPGPRGGGHAALPRRLNKGGGGAVGRCGEWRRLGVWAGLVRFPELEAGGEGAERSESWAAAGSPRPAAPGGPGARLGAAGAGFLRSSFGSSPRSERAGGGRSRAPFYAGWLAMSSRRSLPGLSTACPAARGATLTLAAATRCHLLPSELLRVGRGEVARVGLG